MRGKNSDFSGASYCSVAISRHSREGGNPVISAQIVNTAETLNGDDVAKSCHSVTLVAVGAETA